MKREPKRLTIDIAARRLGLNVEQTIREVYFGPLVAHRGAADGLERTLYFLERDLRAYRRLAFVPSDARPMRLGAEKGRATR